MLKVESLDEQIWLFKNILCIILKFDDIIKNKYTAKKYVIY